MAQTGRARFTPHTLVATAIFGFMHVADEMAGNWDAGAPGGPMGTPMSASISLGIFTLVGMWGLWWLLTNRTWGFGIAAIFGLFFLLTGGSHFLNTADMTTFRWIVVVLEVVSAAIVLILGTNGLWAYKPWKGDEATAA